MLSPEVCVFPPPKSGREHIFSSLSQHKISSSINEHPFYHSILCVFTNTEEDSHNKLQKLFKDCIYYKLTECPLSELFHKNFIEGFIDKGSISCMNIGVDANVGNIITISEQSECNLLLTPKSYQTFGINGVKLKRRSDLNSFHVKIHLSGNQLKLRKKYYDRIYEQSKTLGNYTFLIQWVPHDKEVCPSTIAKYFHDRGLSVETCVPSFSVKKLHTSIPTIRDNCIDDIVEWMGIIAIGGKTESDDPFLCQQIDKFGDHKSEGYVLIYQVNGFFTSSFVNYFENTLRDNSHHSDSKWYSLSLQTFIDLPKVISAKEKKILVTDNVLTYFFDKDKKSSVKWFRVY